MTDLLEHRPHRRRNALTGDWVTVSPQRAARPWQGEQVPQLTPPISPYDPACYLCPGNVRANGERNPDYHSSWAFDNDFPAMLRASELPNIEQSLGGPDQPEELFKSESIAGQCRVICYSPDHSKTLSQLSEAEILAVVSLWSDEVATLRESYRWVQVFENKGAMMGCSNPHPHGQIWAVDSLPNEAVRELDRQRKWFECREEVLLENYRREEEARGERLVASNAHWSVVVPYWAIWPFETLLIPRRRVDHIDLLNREEQSALANVLKLLLGAYDRLFDTSCPYTMGWHGAPGAQEARYWQLHAHVYPPLLRSATVRKYMVGYEMLSEAQRDLTPEAAAAQLRQAIAA
ncbi:MAG: UDP-glucose--hexose-1-phosphate uridylyltransferase [Halieaceae bacterium]